MWREGRPTPQKETQRRLYFFIKVDMNVGMLFSTNNPTIHLQNSGIKVMSYREGVTKEASGPARLMDNSAQISNVADLKFPMNRPQTNLREVKEGESRRPAWRIDWKWKGCLDRMLAGLLLAQCWMTELGA